MTYNSGMTYNGGGHFLDEELENGTTIRDALRLLSAVHVGNGTGLAEDGTMEFRSLDGSKVRVRATMVDGVRTMTLVDPT